VVYSLMVLELGQFGPLVFQLRQRRSEGTSARGALTGLPDEIDDHGTRTTETGLRAVPGDASVLVCADDSELGWLIHGCSVFELADAALLCSCSYVGSKTANNRPRTLWLLSLALHVLDVIAVPASHLPTIHDRAFL